ncbi:MAG: flagellar filament capping protein FliD [Myxococcota bacterium]
MTQPLASFSGLASGLDTSSLIAQLVEVESLPIVRMEDQKADYESMSRRITDIAGEVENTRTEIKKLETEDDILTYTGTSSDSTKVGVTATSLAVPGQYTVQVSALAAAQSNVSDGFSDADTVGLFGTGDLAIQVGTDTAVTISIDGTDTLNTVASKINDSDARAIASVIFDGSTYRLQVVGEDTGVANTVSYTEGGSLAFDFEGTSGGLSNQLVAAVDAAFSVNGLAMTRSSNAVDSAIPGFRLNLSDTTTSAVTISVAQDTSALSGNVQGFVDKFNFMMDLIDQELLFDGTVRLGDSLRGDSALRSTQEQFRLLIVSQVNGLSGEYDTFAQLGVSIDQTGTLTFDSAMLSTALTDDPDSVVEFFTGNDTADGFVSLFDSLTDTYTNADNGVLTARTDGLADRVTDLDDQIARTQTRIDAYEARLRRQYTNLETTVSSLQSQGDQLLAALGSVS